MGQPREPRNWDQLRGQIDSGETGDKIAHPDPATAPLGTDAEAGGSPTAPGEIARSAALQQTAGLEPSRRRTSGRVVLIGVAAACLVVVVVLAALWATAV